MMLQAILVGVGLSAATMIIHAIGTLWWISVMRKWFGKSADTGLKQKSSNDDFSLRRAAFLIGFITTLLIFLHVLEVTVWALCYLILPIDTPATLEEAFYFSSVTFTSLGYGDVVVTGPWRILSGIQAMAGIMVFGWSSALLLTAFMKMLETSQTQTSGSQDSSSDKD